MYNLYFLYILYFVFSCIVLPFWRNKVYILACAYLHHHLFSALETFVIIALYKSAFTIPYHTTVLNGGGFGEFGGEFGENRASSRWDARCLCRSRRGWRVSRPRSYARKWRGRHGWVSAVCRSVWTTRRRSRSPSPTPRPPPPPPPTPRPRVGRHLPRPGEVATEVARPAPGFCRWVARSSWLSPVSLCRTSASAVSSPSSDRSSLMR